MLKVFGYGRIASDPEFKVGNNGTSICNFRVAFRKSTKKVEGQPDANFMQCTAWGGQADFAANYLTKGREVVITGRLENRDWTSNSGEKRSTWEVHIENIQGVGSRDQEEGQ